MAVLVGYQVYVYKNGLTAVSVMNQLLGLMTDRFWGPLIYILLYSIRPLILFPSTILTLAGGFLFGPVLGVLYTIVATSFGSPLYYCGQ